MSSIPKDARPPHLLQRYHKRTRRRVPWMQTLLLLVLLPTLSLLIRLRVRGRENIPGGGYIIACNHPSVLDAVFVALAVRRRIRFMGKSELFTERWGRWLARLGAFPVRRGVWDLDAFETAETVVNRKRVMCMFPEGGVSPQGGYRPAKSGIGYLAHRTGAPVLPIHLDGSRQLYKPRMWAKVATVVGEPITFEREENPSPERCQETAQAILDAIKELV